MNSEGVYSSSTNNLEKAYEDLEREILEIKQKLQGSSIGPSPDAAARQGHHRHQYSQEPDIMNDGTLAHSMGSALQRSGGVQMATGTFQPAQSMTA